MKYDYETLCDGCANEIVKSKKCNKVVMNSAEYDLCDKCYQKLVEWFNKEITV